MNITVPTNARGYRYWTALNVVKGHVESFTVRRVRWDALAAQLDGDHSGVETMGTYPSSMDADRAIKEFSTTDA